MKGISRLTSLLLATLLIVVATAGISWLFWETRTTWPQFPSDIARGQAPTVEQLAAAKSLAPEVFVKVDHDYAYRIGDVIPVTIFLKEKPGTQIDLHSIALEGDFEITGDPVIFERRTADGARRIRAEVKLQSFSAVPKWSFKADLSYRVIATNEDVTISLPAFEAYTSNTWDGRDIIQEGKIVFNYGFEPFATAALLLGGLIGAIYFFVLARRFSREQRVPYDLKSLPNRFLLARRDFNVIWGQMEAGDRSADRYADLSQLVRRLYRVETKTTLEAGYYLLYSYNGPIQVVEVLKACDRVIYRHETLTESDHQQIKQVFDKLVPTYAPEVLAKLPQTKVVMRSAELGPKSGISSFRD
jgi:hypothetical protein